MLVKMLRALSALAVCAGVVGCENKTETGALAGGVGGAAVGGLIGSGSHARAGEGVLIGAGVGAIGGALVGHSMDEADRARDRQYYEERDQATYSAASYRAVPEPRTLTKEDVISWSSRGVRDDIIVDRIDRSGTVFHLTTADENQLRDVGVGEDVIRAMKVTAIRN